MKTINDMIASGRPIEIFKAILILNDKTIELDKKINKLERKIKKLSKPKVVACDSWFNP